MYFYSIPEEVFENKKLSPNAKLLYSVLLFFCNRELKKCIVSNEKLGKMLNITPRIIQKHLLSLKSEGYILITYKDEKIRSDREIKVNIKIGASKKTQGGAQKDTGVCQNKHTEIYNHLKDKYINNTYAQIEDLYNKYYPNKKSKSKGIAHLLKEIRCESDLSLLEKAIINYLNYTKDTEQRYIKHFSTFSKEWRDWVQQDEAIPVRPKIDRPDIII